MGTSHHRRSGLRCNTIRLCSPKSPRAQCRSPECRVARPRPPCLAQAGRLRGRPAHSGRAGVGPGAHSVVRGRPPENPLRRARHPGRGPVTPDVRGARSPRRPRRSGNSTSCGTCSSRRSPLISRSCTRKPLTLRKLWCSRRPHELQPVGCHGRSHHHRPGRTTGGTGFHRSGRRSPARGLRPADRSYKPRTHTSPITWQPTLRERSWMSVSARSSISLSP